MSRNIHSNSHDDSSSLRDGRVVKSTVAAAIHQTDNPSEAVELLNNEGGVVVVKSSSSRTHLLTEDDHPHHQPLSSGNYPHDGDEVVTADGAVPGVIEGQQKASQHHHDQNETHHEEQVILETSNNPEVVQSTERPWVNTIRSGSSGRSAKKSANILMSHSASMKGTKASRSASLKEQAELRTVSVEKRVEQTINNVTVEAESKPETPVVLKAEAPVVKKAEVPVVQARGASAVKNKGTAAEKSKEKKPRTQAAPTPAAVSKKDKSSGGCCKSSKSSKKKQPAASPTNAKKPEQKKPEKKPEKKAVEKPVEEPTVVDKIFPKSRSKSNSSLGAAGDNVAVTARDVTSVSDLRSDSLSADASSEAKVPAIKSGSSWTKQRSVSSAAYGHGDNRVASRETLAVTSTTSIRDESSVAMNAKASRSISRSMSSDSEAKRHLARVEISRKLSSESIDVTLTPTSVATTSAVAAAKLHSHASTATHSSPSSSSTSTSSITTSSSEEEVVADVQNRQQQQQAVIAGRVSTSDEISAVKVTTKVKVKKRGMMKMCQIDSESSRSSSIYDEEQPNSTRMHDVKSHYPFSASHTTNYAKETDLRESIEDKLLDGTYNAKGKYLGVRVSTNNR